MGWKTYVRFAGRASTPIVLLGLAGCMVTNSDGASGWDNQPSRVANSDHHAFKYRRGTFLPEEGRAGDGRSVSALVTEDQDPLAPPYGNIGMYESDMPDTDGPADIYYPIAPGGDDGAPFPVALLLRGGKVDRQYYSTYAQELAAHGFVVVVPGHIPSTALFSGISTLAAIPDVIEFLRLVNGDPTVPVAGLMDNDRTALLGHSLGGVCALTAIMERCQPPCCRGLSYRRPPEVMAGVFWGTNLKIPRVGNFLEGGGIPRVVENHGIPVALLQGELDGMAGRDATYLTYQRVADAPKVFVEITGANHYGICNVNNPPGATPDRRSPELDQGVAIATAARWTGLFLRAHMADDMAAMDYVHRTGGVDDVFVSVESELPDGNR